MVGWKFLDLADLARDEHSAAELDEEAVVVLGTPQSQSVIAAASQHFRQVMQPQKFTIVPLGVRGNLIWNGLPINMATIPAEISPECLIFAQAREVSQAIREMHSASRNSKNCPGKSWLWQFVFEHPETVVVADTLVLNGLSGDSETENTADDWEALPDLVGGRSRVPECVRSRIESFSGESIAEIALRAGLYQIIDDMDVSHELAQSIEWVGDLKLGDYWHAIMHRREPDFSNARYWFRHVGNHPVAKEIGTILPQLVSEVRTPALKTALSATAKQAWSGTQFVTLCEQAVRHPSSAESNAAKLLQWVEMLLLLRFCQRHRNI